MDARPLNATAASLLGFLHSGPLTGWDLVATAEALIGDFWSLTQSQVYRELATMAEMGLVTAGERGRRDRRPYTITRAGRDAFAAWVEREPGPELIRFPHPREVHSTRLTGYREARAALTAGGSEPDPYALATLEFGLIYEEAVLAWFDGLSPDVGGKRRRGLGSLT